MLIKLTEVEWDENDNGYYETGETKPIIINTSDQFIIRPPSKENSLEKLSKITQSVINFEDLSIIYIKETIDEIILKANK